MRNVAARAAASVFFVSIVATLASASDFPISISSEAVSSSLKIKVVDLPDARMWQMNWPRDAKERHLNILLVKANPGKVAANQLNPETLHELSFREGLTEDRDEADVRMDDIGETEIWNGTARWLLGSELAERNPYETGGSSTGKASRGPERRYCLSFAWLEHDEIYSMGGAYCIVATESQVPTAGTMLTALGLTFD